MTDVDVAAVADIARTDRALLEVDGLSVRYRTARGPVSAVDDVAFAVGRSEVLGLVGESGCGKSTVAAAILGLLPANAEVAGSIVYDGEQLNGADASRLRQLRGNRIATIVQDPMTSLDPTFPIGEQIAEAVRTHAKVPRSVARQRALDVLGEVGIPDPRRRYGDPPHRLSGGMRQRVVIAAALVNDPALIVADEPTTALDVTIQAQILALLLQLREERGTAIVLITHDLGVVATVCDRVVVMYAGQIAERAPTTALFAHPAHPYTTALLDAMPSVAHRPGALRVIAGAVPDLAGPLPGCRFAPRCTHVGPRCAQRPSTSGIEGDHDVACWLAAGGVR
jgi:oligopeptide/dipeptide ABC transporter ATP-binding protein